MWERIARVLKSWIGYFISFTEDPAVMLQHSIEEMRNTLPKLNQILITTRATVIRLEQDIAELERKERQLVASIQAALKEGSSESRRIAEDDASTLQQVRHDLGATREQLASATQAFDHAQLSVEEIKGKLRARIEEARHAVEESKKAAVLRGAASALAELDSYGTGATTDKYLDEIRQRTAEARAAVEVATGGPNIERIKSERRVRQLQAQGILAELETEMGLRQPDAIREPAPFASPAPAPAVQEQAETPPAAAPGTVKESR